MYNSYPCRLWGVRVWRVESRVWSIKESEVWRLECSVESVDSEVECRVWGMECGMGKWGAWNIEYNEIRNI